jgi:hypothetical protein
MSNKTIMSSVCVLAKVHSYDSESDTINLSINDSNTISIRFENLQKWVEKMKKMCDNHNYCDSSDDDEED